MKKIKKIAHAPVDVASHVYRNRGRYCFAAGVIAGGAIIRNFDSETYKEALAFIEFKGLTNEFFNPMEADWQEMV
jgi:hypothetical protein